MVPVSWTIHREVVLLLGWARAILLQFAHPLVARGVADHSGFTREGLGRWRRLHRTLGAMLTLTFGTEREAAATLAHINGIHRRVQGRLTAPEGRFESGHPYGADDPALLRWVHATCLDSFLLTYQLFVAPLSPAQRDAYCAESADIEGAMGMPAGYLPRSEKDLAAYVTAMLESDEIAVSETARRLAREVMYPPLGWLGWPVTSTMRLITVGLLPAPVRDAYGFRWTSRHERRLGLTAAMVRRLLPCVPSVIREWPIARRATRRAAGRTASPASVRLGEGSR
jgi:uncharacterized protein (DUF2236 family)